MTITPNGAPAGTYYDATTQSYLADPGGYYSGPGVVGLTGLTQDLPGTYTSPYALDRLVVTWQQNSPDNEVLTFKSAAAVSDFYGSTSEEAGIARQFFAGYPPSTGATLMFARYANGQRPHLIGANIYQGSSAATLAYLQQINGNISMTLTFGGNTFTYSGNVNLSGVPDMATAAIDIRNALNSNLPVAAQTTNSTVQSKSVTFTGHTGGTGDTAHLFVTNAQPGTIQIGSIVSAQGLASGAQIIGQLNGTPGGIGEYSFFQSYGKETTDEQMTASYGLLTVGHVTSGSISPGEKVGEGAGVPALTAIYSNVAGTGTGDGSQWIVNNAVDLSGNIKILAPTFTVGAQQNVGANESNWYFNIQANGAFDFNQIPSSESFVTGSAAVALGLSQSSPADPITGIGAMDASPGGLSESVTHMMNTILTESDQYGNTAHFGTFQSEEPRLDALLQAWVGTRQGMAYEWLSTHTTTTPAGQSTPVTDPAGTHSAAGASTPIWGAATLSNPLLQHLGAAVVSDTRGYQSTPVVTLVHRG